MRHALRHRVLVACPISAQAQARLDVFFDVETRLPQRTPSRQEQIDWLQDKAGVIGDARLAFDAQIVHQLPSLKAISTLAATHEHLDLPALTRAGIRATQAPALDAGQEVVSRLRDAAWERIRAALAQATADCSPAGRYSSRWKRRPVLGMAPDAGQVLLLGQGPLAQALAAQACDEGLPFWHESEANEAKGAGWREADVLVLAPCSETPSVPLNLQQLAALKPGARIVNLAGPGRLADEVHAHGEWLARVDSSLDACHTPPAAPKEASHDRSWVAADELIASLGFGRHSWHPRHLLNSEIACESCC